MLTRMGSTLVLFDEPLSPVQGTNLEQALAVRVMDRSGRQVDKGDPQVDRAEATLLRVSVPQLAAGTYRVAWRVLSVDTHVTEGDFTFDVVP